MPDSTHLDQGAQLIAERIWRAIPEMDRAARYELEKLLIAWSEEIIRRAVEPAARPLTGAV